MSTFLRFLELCPFKCLTKLPVSRHKVVASDSSTITCSHLKREALTIQVRVALPILPPVSRHGLPTSPWPLDGHRVNITSSSNICHQNQVEVWVTIDGEPDTSFLHTRDSVLSQKQKHVNACSKLDPTLPNSAIFTLKIKCAMPVVDNKRSTADVTCA